MKRYEYKTIELKLKRTSIFGAKEADGFEDTLTREGAAGWRYADTLVEPGVSGEASRVKLVFEREME